MKYRLSYAMEEARELNVGEQDYRSRPPLRDGDGAVSEPQSRRPRPRRPSRPSPAPSGALPAQLVLLAMGFLGPEQGLLEQLGVERDLRGNVKAARPYTTLGRRRLRGGRRTPRPVADRVGDQRGSPVRAHRRPLPGRR